MPNRVYLEEADRPPPSYYDEKEEEPHNKNHLKDPKEWVKAPEFVPRSRLLHQAFSMDEGGQSGYVNPMETVVPMDYHHPMMEPPFPNVPFFNGMPPPPPQFGLPFPPMRNPLGLPNGNGMGGPINPGSLPFLPQGYSANITNINTGPGPPIPAIVLKKKRRKRHKNHTNSLILPSPEEKEERKDEEEERIAEEKEEMRGASDDTTRSIASIPESSMIRGSSCPDLSQDQLTVWEKLLYSRVCEERSPPPPPAPRNAAEAMRSSTHDMMSRALREVAEGHIDGYSSSAVRKIDREINGNVMTDSMIVTRLQDHNFVNGNHLDNDASLIKPLSTELSEIAFRPQMTKYGYPQYHDDRAHLTTFHYGSGITSSKIVNKRDLMNDDEDDDRYVEDSIEGFNIRVNHFDEIDHDGSLSESDLPPPSRFEQFHWSLQNKAQQYREAPLRPPDRVCCTIQ
ncbi:hypothetical protein PFISCL1PPCAC_15185 [Pristionchus fissidentatus]|uniref:Uncharacterized protein n=1 Tax=Pristionchus fissidentatus TaxID=1538716 RepID=A0AAV5VZQ2_9BILA|nr:hypothetical protein PFISCL1PPCAC_15185 [Pristionchus fissidentatus]